MSGAVLIALLLAFVALVSATDWRKGLLACIPVGFLQDPARKLTTGEPVWMVVAVTAAMGIVLFFYLGQRNRRIVPILMERTRVRQLLGILVILVLLQALHTVLAYDALMLAALGILFYFSPLPALALASDYPRRVDDLYRFLGVYIVFATLVGCTIVLAWSGIVSSLFVGVGEGFQIYDASTGSYIRSYIGLMRSPDVAAWHLGTGACLALVIALGFRNDKGWIKWVLIALFLLIAGLLTGRRKMLMEIVVFLAIFAAFGLLLRSRAIWKSVLVVTFLGIGLLSVVPQFDDSSVIVLDPTATSRRSIEPYVQRGMTAFGDAGQRMSQLGLGSIVWAYNRAGFFGAGTGTAAQGAQHFGGAKLGGAGEGGLGRITGELGVPGLLLVLAVAWSAFVIVFRRLKKAAASGYTAETLTVALVSFLGANVPIFVAASQVYSDPFVLFVLACCAGFALRLLAPFGVRAVARRKTPVGSPVPSTD